MSIVLAVLAFVVLTIAAAAIQDELHAWGPWLARRLVDRTVKALPADLRARYREEWLAELAVMPGGVVTKCAFAVSLFLRRRTMARSLGRTGLGDLRSSLVRRGAALKEPAALVGGVVLVLLLSPLLPPLVLAMIGTYKSLKGSWLGLGWFGITLSLGATYAVAGTAWLSTIGLVLAFGATLLAVIVGAITGFASVTLGSTGK